MDGGVFTKRKIVASSENNVGIRFQSNLKKSLERVSRLLEEKQQFIDTENGQIKLDEIMKHRVPWLASLSDTTTILYCLINVNKDKIDTIKESYLSNGKTDFTKLIDDKIRLFKRTVNKENEIKPSRTQVRFIYIHYFIDSFSSNKDFINILKLEKTPKSIGHIEDIIEREEKSRKQKIQENQIKRELQEKSERKAKEAKKAKKINNSITDSANVNDTYYCNKNNDINNVDIVNKIERLEKLKNIELLETLEKIEKLQRLKNIEEIDRVEKSIEKLKKLSSEESIVNSKTVKKPKRKSKSKIESEPKSVQSQTNVIKDKQLSHVSKPSIPIVDGKKYVVEGDYLKNSNGLLYERVNSNSEDSTYFNKNLKLKVDLSDKNRHLKLKLWRLKKED